MEMQSRTVGEIAADSEAAIRIFPLAIALEKQSDGRKK
jgi:hypothetical protein